MTSTSVSSRERARRAARPRRPRRQVAQRTGASPAREEALVGDARRRRRADRHRADRGARRGERHSVERPAVAARRSSPRSGAGSCAPWHSPIPARVKPLTTLMSAVASTAASSSPRRDLLAAADDGVGVGQLVDARADAVHPRSARAEAPLRASTARSGAAPPLGLGRPSSAPRSSAAPMAATRPPAIATYGAVHARAVAGRRDARRRWCAATRRAPPTGPPRSSS